MAFKMKGMNFGKGTGFDLPNKVNSGFKKSSKLEGMTMKKDPMKMKKDDAMKMKTKDPMKMEKDPLKKKKGRLRQFAEEVGGELKRVAKNFGNYKDPAQRRRELRAYVERERAKNRKKTTKFYEDTEKNVAQNKAAGPKTKAQTKDEKRPPMAMKKNKEAMKMKTKDAMKMKKDPMKMKKDDAMKMKKDPMKMKHKDPMKLNKGFDKLPKEVQAKILKNKK